MLLGSASEKMRDEIKLLSDKHYTTLNILNNAAHVLFFIHAIDIC